MGSKSKNKQTVKPTVSSQKTVVKRESSYENQKVVWMFDCIDRDGKFAFDVKREDFDAKQVLDKIVNYSSMKWFEIKRQTHDDNKSKHHLLDYETLSTEAKERIKKLRLEEQTDAIFSFAFENMLRVIGIREDEKFHVIWFDPEHKFCPSHKK